MTDLAPKIHSEFNTRFSGKPLLVVAPGRINLIGEHVDYNSGFVLPGAIDKHLIFAVAANGSDRCNLYANDVRESASFALTDLKPGGSWVSYFMGVLAGFRERGIGITGMDCVFGGTIPSGAGLSSSAALCCGFAFALNELFQAKLSRLDLALIAQYSEHKYAGVMCGLMDQYASLFGEKDALLLLDCRTSTHEAVPFPSADCAIILVDTHVKHSLASSAYNDRRAACEEGVGMLQKQFPEIKSLRDASLDQLEQMKYKLRPEVYTRCRFIIEEIDRTRRAAGFLKSGDLPAVGKLMFQTHEGLRDAYEVSCQELDVLVKAAAGHPDIVLGSRLMGGGFGGCTINLVRPDSIVAFKELISREYFTSFKTAAGFHSVVLSQGTHLITR